MSLSARLTETKAKVITLDIERVMGELRVPFWDLSDAKRTSRYRWDDVVAEPQTVLVCWKDYFTEEVEHAAVWDRAPRTTIEHPASRGTRRTIEVAPADRWILRVWCALDDADLVYTFNGDYFDLPLLHQQFEKLGWPDPSPYKSVDLYRSIRRNQYTSNALGYVTQRWGIQTKEGRYDHEVALAALSGDKEAQASLTEYCAFDVRATEAAADYHRPRIKSHPILRGWTESDALVCNHCGSNDFQPLKQDRVANLLTYPAYRCNECLGVFESTKSSGRVGNTRGSGR